jgi:NAD(P)-dependent dehydrogenase (short-subunit alcohol dehydrogenase family)
MRDPSKEEELGNVSGVALMALDVTDPHEIESVAEQVMASGGVDVVFNNAGYGLAGPLEGLTDEQILRMVNTNMLGAIRTTKAFIPYFRSVLAAPSESEPWARAEFCCLHAQYAACGADMPIPD